ncbi:hypothetical protein EB796_012174 [Bugula neritina]|uniref:Uncharacterized protein n=1 Tax=Bugula neritina TaxID=10212 RepID=A0A7J7JU61_BUGNE|nr:hypothetical protein EB796_012174 [Bugula neritina]
MPPPQANQPLYTWGLPSSSKTDKLPEEPPQRGNPFQWRKPWDADESLKPCVTTQLGSDECTLTRTKSAPFSCGSPSTSENIPAADVKCPTKKSNSSSGRKAVVRKCDACRQTFIELEELKIEENEDTCEEEFGPIVEETCTEEVDSDEELLWPHRWHEWPVTMYDTFDSGLDKLQKAQGSQIVDDGGDDCYTYSEFHLGTSLPCHRHKLGDPNCWLSKEPQDIPEDVVYRYFDDYSSARLPGNMSKLKIKRGR